jgi:hypothetical protein
LNFQEYSVKGKPPKRTLDDVSLDLYEGEIFALLGHNGLIFPSFSVFCYVKSIFLQQNAHDYDYFKVGGFFYAS